MMIKWETEGRECSVVGFHLGVGVQGKEEKVLKTSSPRAEGQGALLFLDFQEALDS